MALDFELDPLQARVLGVLIEKELTTPEQYPLTLNALVAGCNQKNNRDPVLDLLDGDVYGAVQKLIKKGAVGSVHPLGGRVEKFRHNAKAILGIETPQLAVMAELMLRGPQQPGELRARAARMAPMETQQALMDLLRPLMESGMVKRLDPLPGSRAERYVQTVAPSAHPIEVRMPSAAMPSASAEGAGAGVAGTTSSGAGTGAGSAGGAHASRTMTGATVASMVLPEMSHLARRDDVAVLEKRIVELEDLTAKLRRQLDHLAWSLGKKLEG